MIRQNFRDDTDEDVVQLLGRLHQVDEVAAQQIWAEYFPRLARLARVRLGSLPRRVFDEEDVASMALRTFFEGASQGRFHFHGDDELWKLLVGITIRTARDGRRWLCAAKRGGGSVRGDSVFQSAEDDDWGRGFEQVLDEHKMPELAEDVYRSCEDLLSLLPNDSLRRTALLRMDGHSNREIAQILNCSVSRIKQRLEEIRYLWREYNHFR